MLKKKVAELLRAREFIHVATCDLEGRPNAAPKFFLKLEGDTIYLVDYIIGKTRENLKVNPKASLCFMDANSLIGYQINGPVEILESGREYEEIILELERKELDLSIRRIIEGVSQGTTHSGFELSLPNRFVIFRIRIKEVVEIGLTGELKRETL